MSFGDRLKQYREAKGYTQEQLAGLIGVAKTTITGYERGNRAPDVSKIKKLAAALDVTGDDLLDTKISAQRGQTVSNGALHLAQAYDKLDAWGQKQVWSVTDNELARCAGQAQGTPAREADETVYYITSWFYHPMSAGTGEQAGDDQPESLRLIKEPPRGTSYVAPVHGDSMEPTYHSGDKLFICACEEIEPGQIGVFYMDGQQWVKELGDGVLISHNPAYPLRPMTEDIRCQGLVLGVCDDSYFK